MEKEIEVQEKPAKKNFFKVTPKAMTVIYAVSVAAMAVGLGFVFWKLLGVLK